MPNRIIKESICTSDSLSQLSWFEQAVFFRLIVLADDFGIFDARSAIIRGRAFPLHSVTDKQIDDALSKLATVDMIYLYTVGGKPYLQLKTWGEHQQIRATKSKYPKPENADLQSVDSNCNQLQSVDSNCNQLQSVDSNCPRNPIQSNPNPNPNPKEKKGRFTPPTLDEVKNYCSEQGYSINPEQFINYYEANGWMVGKNKMKDWRAAVRNWVSRDSSSVNNKNNALQATQHPAKPTQEETERLKRYAESLKGG